MAPNEFCVEEAHYFFQTANIDQKGPPNLIDESQHHCLLVIDAFSQFIEVYPVKATDANHTNEAITTFITSFGTHQQLLCDQANLFMKIDFFNMFSATGQKACITNQTVPMALLKIGKQNKYLTQKDKIDGTYLKQSICGPN